MEVLGETGSKMKTMIRSLEEMEESIHSVEMEEGKR